MQLADASTKRIVDALVVDGRDGRHLHTYYWHTFTRTQQEWPAALPLIKNAKLVNGTFAPPELDYPVRYTGLWTVALRSADLSHIGCVDTNNWSKFFRHLTYQAHFCAGRTDLDFAAYNTEIRVYPNRLLHLYAASPSSCCSFWFRWATDSERRLRKEQIKVEKYMGYKIVQLMALQASSLEWIKYHLVSGEKTSTSKARKIVWTLKVEMYTSDLKIPASSYSMRLLARIRWPLKRVFFYIMKITKGGGRGAPGQIFWSQNQNSGGGGRAGNWPQCTPNGQVCTHVALCIRMVNNYTLSLHVPI